MQALARQKIHEKRERVFSRPFKIGAKKSPITHIDLFAGPGGICTGFKAAGLRTVLAVEYVDSCAETYRANHPEVEVLVKDVRYVENKEIERKLQELGIPSIDIVSAGFPCETFSTAGSKSRVYNDHRNFLYKESIRIADAAGAKILLLENVPAFVSKRVEKGSDIRILDLLIQDLEAAGFKYHDHVILNAADYGVPQRRQRFILMASKTIPIKKEMFNGNKKSRRVTIEEALSDLPNISDSSSSSEYATGPKTDFQKLLRSKRNWVPNAQEIASSLSYHVTTKHRPTTIERFKLISPGEGLKDLFNKLGLAKVKKLQEKKILPSKWYIQRNQRLVADQQSMTVTSHCLDEMIHPTLNRSLSVRELARLQSFPDHYDFKGGPLVCPHIYKTQDKFEQIGDAVPPLLARHLGESVVKILGR